MQDDRDGPSTADVSVLGLGAMGSAIAATLVRAGPRVAVWNRSPGRMAPLAALGAQPVSTAEGAVRASDVTIMVVLDAEAARATLDLAPGAIAGRTIVNFSSGGPEDLAALRDLVIKAGGRYLGGEIIAYPRNIGHPQAFIRYWGDEAAFEAHREILGRLAGHTPFHSPAVGATLGPAITLQMFAAMGSFYEAVALGARLGGNAPEVARTVVAATRFFVADALDDAVRRLEQNDFGGEQATIDTHVDGLDKFAAALAPLNAPTLTFDAFLAYLKQAQAAGLGGEDVAATVKALAG